MEEVDLEEAAMVEAGTEVASAAVVVRALEEGLEEGLETLLVVVTDLVEVDRVVADLVRLEAVVMALAEMMRTIRDEKRNEDRG